MKNLSSKLAISKTVISSFQNSKQDKKWTESTRVCLEM